MRAELTVKIPNSLFISSNSRLHFRRKAELTAELRRLAGLLAARSSFRVDDICSIDVSVSIDSARRFDPANAYPSIKAILDGVVDSGMLVDDSSDFVESLTFRRGAKCVRGFKVFVLVFEW